MITINTKNDWFFGYKDVQNSPFATGLFIHQFDFEVILFKEVANI